MSADPGTEEPGRHGRRWWLGGSPAAWLLVLVGVAYLVVQAVAFSPHRSVSWDEAVYLSQLDPDAVAVRWAASRARGITFLPAPMLWLGGPLVAVRWWMAAASSAALVGAFWVWISATGVGAAVAAFGFGSTWLALLYGSEVMPNLWTALIAVATVGFVARWAAAPTDRLGLLLAGVGLAVVALFRPTDATVLVVAIAAYLAVFRRDRLREAWVLGVGLVVGWAPWLVEMSARYGGLAEAFREGGSGGHVTVSDVGTRLQRYLALTDGPTLASGPRALAEFDPSVPLMGALWWASVLVLAVVALVRSRRTREGGPVLLAAIAGAALAAEYILFVQNTEPRFLLPAYGLLSIPAGVGVATLVRGRSVGRTLGSAALALVVALAVWHVAIANRLEEDLIASRGGFERVGLAIASLADGSPCVLGSRRGPPQILYLSGCAEHGMEGVTGTEVDELMGVADGRRAFILLNHPPPVGSPLHDAAPARQIETGGLTRSVYELPLPSPAPG